MMGKQLDKIKPGVDKRILILLAFLMWFAVGTMLLLMAFSWLRALQSGSMAVFILIGVCAALVIHHFGFLKIVDKNLGRILPLEGKKCLFAFMPWKSYAIIVVMVTMGTLLRHSRIPKTYLSMLYIGIGLSLVLSSFRYFRFFLHQSSTPE
jgi:hypothetical protein